MRGVDCRLAANEVKVPSVVLDAGSTGAFIYVVGVDKTGQEETEEKKGNKKK